MGLIGSKSEERKESFSVAEIKPIVKDTMKHLSLLKTQSEAAVDIIQTQQTIVEQILAENKSEAMDTVHTDDGSDVDVKHVQEEGGAPGNQCKHHGTLSFNALFALMLELSKNSTLKQAECLQQTTEMFEDFLRNSLEQFSYHTKEDTPGTLPIQNAHQKGETGYQQLQDDLNKKGIECKEYLETIHTLQKQSAEMKKTVVELERANVKLKEVCQKSGTLNYGAKSRMKVTAQLYCPRKGELSSMVSKDIKTMLETQFSTQNTDFSLIPCDTPSSIDPDKPGLVLCINASRLGTDVSNALSGIKLNDNIAVVILHHKEMHAQPNQPSERVLTSSECKQLGGIFDMAFVSGKGIYPCDMNNTAVSNLVNFIRGRN